MIYAFIAISALALLPARNYLPLYSQRIITLRSTMFDKSYHYNVLFTFPIIVYIFYYLSIE